MLDSLFESDSEITGENASSDISGLIGQYAHGNEPSHHIAYLYNYAGTPWKTQERVHEILTTMYNDRPTGLCGNEDCGQMSAWYVFSAIGFYPVNPAQGIYIIGSPLMESTQILVNDNKTFHVEARGLSENNIYVDEIILNGESLDRLWITHEEIMNGGKLELEMSDEPNTVLGTSVSSRPPDNVYSNR
jgi:predicted alpha-1,2-mannosidase